jgi:hypothetical protein
VNVVGRARTGIQVSMGERRRGDREGRRKGMKMGQ